MLVLPLDRTNKMSLLFLGFSFILIDWFYVIFYFIIFVCFFIVVFSLISSKNSMISSVPNVFDEFFRWNAHKVFEKMFPKQK